ncbi:GntR family transcriptional regulator [Mycolicibacterium sp. P9-64]|uniref:GntR family transcriptional regulator n=1 Tax=Mycolicibacterium sp. P9-64 TaxID=2024612 RepID=UPI0011EF0A6D|nr:GntR family transcriptional regulator [Mycolicibacterium sp. P9-64]KAA0078887.1 GntR family transcriptional regulator [Mycolicibacterium sp. P9-64]
MDPGENITLRRTSTAQQVADGLSDAIMRGEMRPGAPIRESAIAASLGISRNTVREAVRVLEAGGLVKHTMHHGATVVDPSQDDLAELYRARMALELSAASTPRSVDELAPVRSALQDLMTAYETRDPAAIAEKDLGFHAAIVSMLGSKRIDEFYDQLARELRFFLVVLSVEDREFESQEGVIEEHTSIMEALESGDPDRARTVLEAILTESGDRVAAIFAKRSS